MIHWPVPVLRLETWRALERLTLDGRVRDIGVSNYLAHHLEDLLRHCQIVPSVNQVEFHPLLVQPELLSFCQSHKIQVEGWSPLMSGKIFTVQAVQRLAEKYKKTPAQISLRWALQHEVVTIPKSTHANRIAENAQVFDFELSQADMDLLDALDEGKRTGPHPDKVDF